MEAAWQISFSGDIQNALDLLAQNQIDIEGLSLTYGNMKLVTSQPMKAYELLLKAGYPTKVTKVLKYDMQQGLSQIYRSAASVGTIYSSYTTQDGGIIFEYSFN